MVRLDEGFYSILIQRHLFQDVTMFRKFFCANISQFKCMLSLLGSDLEGKSCVVKENNTSTLCPLLGLKTNGWGRTSSINF